jgi:Tfp pilus assembly protein PilN
MSRTTFTWLGQAGLSQENIEKMLENLQKYDIMVLETDQNLQSKERKNVQRFDQKKQTAVHRRMCPRS